MKLEHIVKHVRANRVSFAATLVINYKWPVYFAIQLTKILTNPNLLKKLHTFQWYYLTRLFLSIHYNVKRDLRAN